MRSEKKRKTETVMGGLREDKFCRKGREVANECEGWGVETVGRDGNETGSVTEDEGKNLQPYRCQRLPGQ